MSLVAAFQAAVALLLTGLIALVRQPDRLRWAITTLTFGLVIASMWISARWDIVSVHFRTLLPVLFVAASVLGYRRIFEPAVRPGRLQAALGLALSAVIAIFMGGLIWFSLVGYAVPAGAIDLASPLRDARLFVVHGGGSPFINAHARIRPQRYALDIVALDPLGRRKRLFAGDDELTAYVIYGAPVYSPCNGTVVASVDEHQDLRPPARDTEHLAGNYVLISCKEVQVVLAHLKQGSVVVAVGDEVTPGTILGAVGNTGNTSEPHLHVHAERGGEAGVILSGEGVPITIGGRFLVRGNTFVR